MLTKASTAPQACPDIRTPPYRHPDPIGQHLLVWVGPFEVRVDSFREGGGNGQGVLRPHGEGTGSPRRACNRAKPSTSYVQREMAPLPTQGWGEGVLTKSPRLALWANLKKKSPRLWMRLQKHFKIIYPRSPPLPKASKENNGGAPATSSMWGSGTPPAQRRRGCHMAGFA